MAIIKYVGMKQLAPEKRSEVFRAMFYFHVKENIFSKQREVRMIGHVLDIQGEGRIPMTYNPDKEHYFSLTDTEQVEIPHKISFRIRQQVFKKMRRLSKKGYPEYEEK